MGFSDYFWNPQWPGLWIIGPLMMIGCMAMMYLMMHGHRRGRTRDSGDDDALAILKARFARGDITRSEFEQQRRILEV